MRSARPLTIIVSLCLASALCAAAEPVKVVAMGYCPVWTPDGGTLVYGSAGREEENVWAVDLEDLSARALTAGGGFHPAVSPDGTALAYDSRGATGAVYRRPLGGGEAKRITPNGMTGNFSCWTPDGSRIFFCAEGDIWSVLSDGGEAVPFRTPGPNDLRPAISPDSRRVAFDSAGSGPDAARDIWILELAGHTYTNLTDAPSHDIQASWSPDGSRIAFASDRSGNLDVWIMARDGSDPVQVTRHEGRDVWPRWSPDGSKIAFGSDRDGAFGIWIVELEPPSAED